MNFQDVITKVEKNTENQQMLVDVHKHGKNRDEMVSFDAVGHLKNAVMDLMKDGNPSTIILFEYANPEGKVKSFRTYKERSYFEECIGKKVFLSGLICEEEHISTLYVSSCYSVEERHSVLDDCDTMTEEQKKAFQKKIQQFSPEMQRDLSKKCVTLSEREIVNNIEETPVTYIDMEEMDVLYNVLQCMIPIEFRTEYNNCKRMMEKHLSEEEKKNCVKVISNILSFDWENEYYKIIDVDAAVEKIKSTHIGHEQQLEEIKTQLLICNHTKKAPKTLSFIGRSCGCDSLATAIAESIGRKCTELNLSGRNSKDTDYLAGTSRIYSNGRCGLIFEKIMEIGTHGVLIIKNIDSYDVAILDFITALIEKKTYIDTFMEIPVDLSDLWVICTSSSTKKLPMSLRKATHEIHFSKINQNQLIRVINEVMLPKQCEAYNIAFQNKLSEDVCRALIYELSHYENKRLEMNIEALVVKMFAEGKTEFPAISIKDLKEYFHFTENEEMIGEYVTDIGELENKYYTNYDMYPDSVRERVEELLEDIRYGDDQNMEAYAILALRYLINPIKNGTTREYEIGQIETKLRKERYGQDDLACQVDDALMAEYLSGSSNRMTVLGLWGPPGTGKTTAAEAIAKALNRGYIKINFGGASDASIIKGKNKSVPNAGPSLLMSKLARKKGNYSYVVNFDEFDKGGSPESYEAFHEFLDPASDWYYDEYLECNIPKNNFLIILTFNDISKIPTPILDRMRLIAVDGYSLSEKKAIVKRAVLKNYEERLKIENASITDAAMDLLLREYSVASGIRDVEKDIEKLLIRTIKKENKYKDICITEEIVREVLGSKRTWGLNDMGSKMAIPGQVIALAVSGTIGSCIAIQVVQDPYQKEMVEISGLLKGSCLESLSDAMSYARRTLKKELPKLHISFRDPNTSKDGASAGLSLYMAIMSCMLDKRLEDCAFTGTICAFGNVGIIGGLNEKLSAAEREGIKRVYIPLDNYSQLKENKMLNRYKIEIIPVSHVNELNKEFFGLEVRQIDE